MTIAILAMQCALILASMAMSVLSAKVVVDVQVMLGVLGAYVTLLILYLAGWEHARYATVIVLAINIGAFVTEPYLTQHGTIGVLVPGALALVLANVRWMLISTAVTLLTLLVRAGWTGVYTDPQFIVFIAMVLGCMVLNRRMLAQTLRNVERSRATLAEQAATISAQYTALVSSEDRFATIFQTAPVPISISTVAGGRYLAVNDAFAAMTGYAREEMLGSNALQLKLWVTEADRLQLVGRLQADGVLHEHPTQFRAKHGDIHDVLCSASLITWEGQPAILVAIRDVTVERQLQAKLLQSNKLESVGRLAGGVAHDFNNLLQVMAGCTEAVRGGVGAQHPAQQDISVLFDTIFRAGNLVAKLLRFARQQPLQRQQVHLNGLVEGIVPLLASVLGRHQPVRLDLDSQLGVLTIDPVQIEQVIVNMAVNARDAMADGGTFAIVTRAVELDPLAARVLELAPGSYATMTFRDTGAGIPPDVLPRIFEPFFTTKEQGKGSGLGLATCYGVAHQHSGALTVESYVGQGTSFTLYLPIDEPRPAGAHALAMPAVSHAISA